MVFLASVVLITSIGSTRARAQSPEPKVAIVVDGKQDDSRRVVESLSKSLEGRATVSVNDLERVDTANPIEKGKFVAMLQTRDLVIAVGDDATGFVSHEVEDTRVYFVGAGLVAGGWLSSKLTAGTFSYNVDRLLDAVQALWPGTMGVAYTPGYEPVVDWIRAGARARGLTLREKRIGSLKGLSAAIRELVEKSKTIWVLGDPMLVRGAGFDFLAERALSNRLPIVAPGLWEIEHGAFLSFRPEPGALVSRASEAIGQELSGETAPRFQPASGGMLLVNQVLANKWKVAVPPDLHWQPAH